MFLPSLEQEIHRRETAQKMDMHDMALVEVSPCMAKAVLAFNILVPGLGTIMAGCAAKGDPLINNFIVGLLQMVLTPFFLVGWFWSLIIGLQIYHKSHSSKSFTNIAQRPERIAKPLE